MNRLVYALPLVLLVLFAGLAGGRLLLGHEGERFEVSRSLPAPDTALDRLDGDGTLVLSGLDTGPALVNLWASWCAPCKVEHPVLMALSARGVPIYGVLYKDTPENGQAVLDTEGNPFLAVGLDPSGRVALDMGLSGVPDTYLIDEAGRILCRRSGVIAPEEVEAIAADLHAICRAPSG